MSQRSTARPEFFRGMRAALPVLIGIIPTGVAFGVLALRSGLVGSAAVGMSLIVFAGSAQFVSLPLLSSGVMSVLILVTVLLLNARHLLYSASLARYTTRLRISWRLILSYLLTDEIYAVSIAHYNEEVKVGEDPSIRHWYFLGVGFTIWLSWQLGTFVGVFIGAAIPSSWPLDFAVTLTFVALLVPSLKEWVGVAASILSGAIAVAAFDLPFRLNILIAVGVSVTVSLIAEQIKGRGEARS